MKNENITLYGDGMQTRSFCYVDDLIQAIVTFMKSKDEIIGPINLGNPIEFTIRGLAELVVSLTNSRAKIEYKPLPADDPKQRQPNIDTAKKSLGWEPQIGLEEGLVKTITYFENLLSGVI